MIRRTPRKGFTLLEILAVMTVLVLLGVMLVPTLTGVRGNTNLKASASLIRGMLAEARAKAIEDGRNYRMGLAADGRTLRIEPDVNAITGEAVALNAGETPIVREEQLPAGVTVSFLDEAEAVPDATGLQRVATLLPDGTCREDNVFLQIHEEGAASLTLRIRGLTGSATVVAAPSGGQP